MYIEFVSLCFLSLSFETYWIFVTHAVLWYPILNHIANSRLLSGQVSSRSVSTKGSMEVPDVRDPHNQLIWDEILWVPVIPKGFASLLFSFSSFLQWLDLSISVPLGRGIFLGLGIPMAQDVGAFVGAVALCGFVGPASLAGWAKSREDQLSRHSPSSETCIGKLQNDPKLIKVGLKT